MVTTVKAKDIYIDDYERVVVFRDDDRFFCCIAVHCTRLGPAIGGCRIYPYSHEQDTITDALRLSRGMSYKASLAGLNLGGGKCTVRAERPTPELMHQIGEAIEHLDGLYASAEDVGTTVDDMRIAAERTSHIATLNGSGDPSPWTALGVLSCMEAACAYAGLGGNLYGMPIWVQGLGKVGWDLASRLSAMGARLYVTDLRPERVADAVTAFDARPYENTDNVVIYAPCAMGQVISDATVDHLRFRVICGSANNQSLLDEYAEVLQFNNVLYVPDYLANAGGIINVNGEYEQPYDPDEVYRKVRGLGERLFEVLDYAKAKNITPLAAANKMAEQRLFS